MTGGTGEMNAEDCAKGLFSIITEKSAEDSGKFFHRNGEVLPW
jgi:hypothetical protein